ncbi:hypothetical protein NA57DRAFT_37781 [Rhizodiscina lignyota]|uniref:Golgi apparatus membrane protein TVP38 n=1 Tax=Rhizodiscina lignyota TaxID=1504668 RepID=A0A9P4IJG0_9PEZI|nr:hypothetical protein NA57DRAFT_37781 [Rhizodiscina lignyota]
MSPSDYDPRALALPIDDDDGSPDPSSRRSISPAWARRSGSFHSDVPADFKSRLYRRAAALQRQAYKTYNRLTLLQRILLVLAGLATFVLGILFLIYNEKIFGWLAPYAKRWREMKAGWLILWAMTFVVSFPPLIGYSSCVTIAGFVYGFPNGWFIVASATIIGSTVSFVASRTLLRNLVHRLVSTDPRFASLALTLKHDGIKLLIMIRLCPLPYSFSNGAISMIPTVHPLAFMLATAVVSPKLMLHVFIGSQLARLAETGDKMDAKTKAISYISIVIGVLAGVLTGWFIYRQTKKRAEQLEAEERMGVRRESIDELRREYADDPEALAAAETLREDEDDISLREGGTYEDLEGGEYRDDFSEEEDAREVGDVFDDGDGEDDLGRR